MPVPSGFSGTAAGYYTRGDGAGPWFSDGTTVAPLGGVQVTYASGNVANATATATVPAVAGRTGYITGFEVTGAGATAASVVAFTITGLLGGTSTWVIVVPAGATTSITPLTVSFPFPVPASAANTAIVASLPALGAGNTNAAVVLRGFSL